MLEDWAAAAAAPPAGPDAGAPAAPRSAPATEKGALWLLRRLFSPSLHPAASQRPTFAYSNIGTPALDTPANPG